MTQNIAHNVVELIQGQNAGIVSRRIFLCCCALMAIEGYDMQVAGYAAPAMIAELHTNRALFSTVFSLGMLGYMLGAIFLGTLSDRVGRRRVILFGTLFFGVLTFATAFTRDFPTIAALRFFSGLGLGAVTPATIALSAEYAPSGSRGRRITIMYLGYTLGGAISGFVAAHLLGMYGWTSLFVVGGVLPMMAVAAIVFFLPESARFLALDPKRKHDLIAVLRKLRPDVPIGEHDDFYTPEIAVSGVPLSHLFKNGRLFVTVLLWVCVILNFVAMHFITSWMPTVLNASGLSLTTASLVSSTFLLGGGMGGIASGYFIDKGGFKPVALMLFLAVPCILAIGFSENELALTTLGVSLAGFTLMGGQIGLNAVSGIIYPTSMRSTGVGWALGIGRVGSILGPAIGGALLTYHISRSLLFVAAATPVLLSAICFIALIVVRSRRQQTEASHQMEHIAQAVTTH